MDDNKWIDRLLVLATDKKELDGAYNGSSIINFVYRIYDDMFDFEKNNDVVETAKDRTTFQMVIMNKRLVIVYENGNQYMDFYFNNELGNGEDSVLFGKLAVTNKVFRFVQDAENPVKFDRILLEKIATDLFKPITENKLYPTYSF